MAPSIFETKSANKVLDQFGKRQKDALDAGRGGESKDFIRLEQQLQTTKQALKDFKKLATTGSREDALKFYDENKLADTMSKIRSLTELVKDFYDAANIGRKKGGLQDILFDSAGSIEQPNLFLNTLTGEPMI